MSFLSRTIYGNAVSDWLIALGVLVLALGSLWLLKRFVARRLAAFARRTKTGVDDLISHMLGRTRLLFLVLIALWAASLTLALPPGMRDVLTRLAVLALLLQGGTWAAAAISFWVERYRERELKQDPASVTTMSALSFVGKLVVWAVVLLLALDNLGVQVTALLTGLGVGGIAVALAVQNILSDLFASMSIILDKPFVIGDFLSLGDFQGSVEHIGLKTTRLRSISGEQLVISNSDLLQSRIRNYGRMGERRIVFSVGVTYDTPREKLARIPSILREIVEAQESARFDRAHFTNFGDFSLDFETVYYVLRPDYALYRDVQQAMNLEIHRRFEEEGIEFAYPTQLVLWKPAAEGS
ncbi:MAG: mechanosensitive ion channel family protein [Gemmatimonadota bacterium]